MVHNLPNWRSSAALRCITATTTVTQKREHETVEFCQEGSSPITTVLLSVIHQLSPDADVRIPLTSMHRKQSSNLTGFAFPMTSPPAYIIPTAQRLRSAKHIPPTPLSVAVPLKENFLTNCISCGACIGRLSGENRQAGLRQGMRGAVAAKATPV